MICLRTGHALFNTPAPSRAHRYLYGLPWTI
jgi:hypothetical protein